MAYCTYCNHNFTEIDDNGVEHTFIDFSLITDDNKILICAECIQKAAKIVNNLVQTFVVKDG
ncbi:MAG: hypothetical protein ACYSSI_00150 [Planctomycetota bacterium]|jgi:hypothetical protein